MLYGCQVLWSTDGSSHDQVLDKCSYDMFTLVMGACTSNKQFHIVKGHTRSRLLAYLMPTCTQEIKNNFCLFFRGESVVIMIMSIAA